MSEKSTRTLETDAQGRSPHAAISFRPSFLLLGLFFATIPFFVPDLRVFRDISGAPTVFGTISVAMTTACLACALVITAIAMRSKKAPSFSRRVVGVSAVLYSLAQVALWLFAVLSPDSITLAGVWILGIVLGLTCVPLLDAWLGQFDALDFRSILFHSGCVCLTMAAFALVLALIPRIASAPLWCIAAASGSFAPFLLNRSGRTSSVLPKESEQRSDGLEQLLAVSPRYQPQQESDGEITAQSSLKAVWDMISAIWVPLLGLLIGLLCSGMTEMSLDNGTAVRSEFVSMVLASLLAIVLSFIQTKSPLVVLVDRLVVPLLCALAIVMSGLPTTGIPSSLLSYLVYLPVSFMTIYGASCIASIRNYPRLFIASTMLIVCCLTMLLGTALNISLDSIDITGPIVHALMSILYAIVLAELCVSAWRSAVERDALEDETSAEVEPAPASDPESLEEARAQHARQIASTYGLTARESEVADYLSRGFNANYIAKALFISGNTVRTHMRSIYRKMNINSRQEFLRLFNESE